MSNQQQQTATAPAVRAKITESDITGSVLTKIEAFESNGELRLPKDYSAANALKSAWLVLQEVEDRNKNRALDVCTKESIANSLLKMIIWGLSPLKNQGYFIVYGKELTFAPDYSGNILLAKRYGKLKWIKGNAIFKDDIFEFEVDGETGRRRIIKHEQSLESFGSNDIKGAYAVYELEDGTRDVEIMNFTQIMASWQQGATKGASPAHTKFKDQMAIKTAINRACKLLIRGSDDSVLYDQEDDMRDEHKEGVKESISRNANRKEMAFEDAEIVEDKPQSLPEATEKVAPPVASQEPEKVTTNADPKAGVQPSLSFDD